jgi:hypothetical protein
MTRRGRPSELSHRTLVIGWAWVAVRGGICIWRMQEEGEGVGKRGRPRLMVVVRITFIPSRYRPVRLSRWYVDFHTDQSRLFWRRSGCSACNCAPGCDQR